MCNRFTLSIILFLSSTIAQAQSKFLLLLGPSGVGKSTIIKRLKELDNRFEYISPLTTRPLRDGEKDKIHVSLEEIHKLDCEGKLLTINNIYGTYYATPKQNIDLALSSNRFPVLDWPAQKMDIMLMTYPTDLFVVYIAPENNDELLRRLSLDNRDINGQRYSAGKDELEKFYLGSYDSFIDIKIVNAQGNIDEIAHLIYQAYCNAIQG